MPKPTESRGRPLRVILFLHSLGYLRFFDCVIRALLDRGHQVHLLLEHPHQEPNEAHWLEEMERRPGFSWSSADALRRDRWRLVARPLRRASDYVRFLAPDWRRTPYLVARAENRAPDFMRRLMRKRLARSAPSRRAIARVLALLESAIPSSRALEAELAALRPDVLAVCPHLMPGARHSEYVKTARALGIRSCICVASWDNLSSKQLIHELPDRVIVWNEIQRREAVELHEIPPDRIVITGAQSFDLWFDWPPRPREEFCARVGLDPARPYVVYLGGSLFPADVTEAEFVRTWIAEVRREPALSEVAVLIRPHPNRTDEWDRVNFDDVPNVAVWPRSNTEMPVDHQMRADYYDSIYHSAAVAGLNTSAMIEAAIVGRPVHTILVPEFGSSQRGTLHFDYLLEVADGLPQVAASFDEHRAQIAEAVRGRDGDAAGRRRRFLEAFVRPHGLDVPATPVVADAIEAVAALGPAAPERMRWALLPLRATLVPLTLVTPTRMKVRLELGRVGRSVAQAFAGRRPPTL